MESIQDIIKNEGLGRNFRGIWIPASIWLNEKLSVEEKILWAEIDSLEGIEGCFASNSYFAKFLKKSERQIKRYLETLKKEKFIEIKNPGGKDRKIFSLYKKPTGTSLLLTGTSVSQSGGHPCHPHNIVDNNISSKKFRSELDLYPTVDKVLKKHGLN